MSNKFYLVGYSGQNLTGHTSKPSFDSAAEAKEYQRKYKHVSTIARAKIVNGTSDKNGFITPIKESVAVIGFRQFTEGVFDPTVKRTSLSSRSEREQAAISASKKAAKDAANHDKIKLVVHIKFDDGKIEKHKIQFNYRAKSPEDRENKINKAADDVLKNMQYIIERFPKPNQPKPIEVVKIEEK